MKMNSLFCLLFVSSVFLSCGASTDLPQPAKLASFQENIWTPNLSARYFSFPLSDALMNLGKARLNEPGTRELFLKVKLAADRALTQSPPSVMEKKTRLSQLPPGTVLPSDDLHNFISFARYGWPNPNTTSGLPYVPVDGKPNTKMIGIGDETSLDRSLKAVNALTLAYAYTDNLKYADKAIEYLRAFFIRPETRMNPNLDFGQIYLGNQRGTPGGILQARGLTTLVDVHRILRNRLSVTDSRVLQQWMKDWQNWLDTSDLAQAARTTVNNHSTWFSSQSIGIKLFQRKNTDAMATCESVKQQISSQISSNGLQLFEARRADGLHYSVFNLNAFFVSALLCERLNVDLWNFTGASGGSLKKASLYLLPYLKGERQWPFSQGSYSPDSVLEQTSAWMAAKGWK